jgi:hypothetical protein
MPEIRLCVTLNVLNQLNNGNNFQRQLAIRRASDDIDTLIRTASAENRIQVDLLDVFTLVIGDTSAIWASHQQGQMLQDFNDLFSLLSRRPDTDVTFIW